MDLPAGLTRQRRELIKLWLQWRLVIIGVAVLVVVAGAGNYAYQRYAVSSAAERSQEIQAQARAFGKSLGSALQAEWQRAGAAVAPQALAPLLVAREGSAIAEAEQRLAAASPDVLRARVLEPDVSDVDYDQSPPLDYAGLDMIRASESSGTAPPPEVHLLGSDDQHISMLVRITDADGGLLGHVLLQLDVAVIGRVVAGQQLSQGYAELRQTLGKGQPLVLAKFGSSGARQGQPSFLTNVPGSGWQLAYWAPGGPREGAGAATGLLPWAIAAAVALLLGVAGMLVLRRRRAAATAAQPAEVPLNPEVGAPAPEPPPTAAPIEIETAPAAGEAPSGAAEAGPSIDLPASIFRAYDVRGIVGKTLNVDIVQQIGRAIGSEAQARGQQTIIVGCDGRRSGPELLQALTEGLRESGRDVIDIGRVPTPVLYFATYYLNTGSGVIVTGSHNPPEYNGLKIMLGEETLFGDSISALRKRVEDGDLSTGAGGLQSMDIVPEYIRRVSEDVPVALGNAYKVVVDCGNGVAGEVAPKLLRALGHDVVELYCDVDGSFPNHHPDPSQPQNLEDLIRTVKEQEADIGFAFDGDGDRLGVVDGRGNIIWPDRQMMLYARDVLSRNRGAQIVYDVKCSNRLGRVVAKLGGKPLMWKTGHSFIKGKMRETGALLAGEMSGHIFFRDRWYGFDDALYTSARMLEILLALKRPPSDIFARLPNGVSTPELRVDMEEGAHLEFMRRLGENNPFSDGKLSTIDGVRVDWPDGWGLVRASNTTPCLVLRFEGDDAQALERIQEQFRKALLDMDAGLELPF